MVKEKTIFVVTGRLGRSLVYSKVLPISKLGIYDRIIVFSEVTGPYIGGTDYIILPKFIRNCKFRMIRRLSRILYEPLQLIYHSIRLRPKFILGIYTNPKGLNSWIASVLSGRKCIIAVIGGRREIENSFFNKGLSLRLNLFLLKRSCMVLTKGKADNDYLIERGIDKSKLIIYNGAIDIARFHPSDKKRDIDVIFVGHFDTNKGPDRFLAICKNLINRMDGLSAFMLGNGPLHEEIKNDSLVTDKKSGIVIAGKVENVMDYLKRSKVMILPSASEGLSTAMLEAMACGCIPIVTDTGNNTEAAIHGFNSYVVKSHTNIDEFTGFAFEILRNDSLREEISSNAVKTINDYYTVSVQAGVLSGILT